MQKPASLRAALTAALPELRQEPDRLSLWVEDGAVRTRQTASQGFAFEYPLSVLLREVKTDIAIAVHAINRWLRRHQPDLLAANKAESFKFETDIISEGVSDILFTVQLIENVAITDAEGGGWSIDYLVEPDPLLTGAEPIDGIVETPPLSGVTVEDIVAN